MKTVFLVFDILLEKIGQRFQVSPRYNLKKNPTFNMDSFSWQNSFDILFFGLRGMLVVFESTAKFRFSTSYDLKTAKLA